MKKFFPLFIIFLLVFIGTVQAAQPITLEPVENTITTHKDRYVSFVVVATNNQNTAEDFQLIIDGTHLEWTFPSHIITHLEPSQPKRLGLDLNPIHAPPGEYVYKFELVSKDTEIRESVPLYLIVKEYFMIDAFDAIEGDSGNLDLAFAYDTVSEQGVDIFVKVKTMDRKDVTSARFTETIKDQGNLRKTIELPKGILAGDYSVEVDFIPYVIGDLISLERVFTVAPIHDVVETESRTVTPLYEEIVVTATNNGNIGESDYVIYQSVRSDFLTGHITDPESCNVNSGQNTCEYVLSSLAPGESNSIVYRIEYWPIYVQVGVILIVIISLIGYSFSRATSPTIKKVVKKKGKQTYSVTLHLKNPFRHHLRGVMIRDWISPLADITPEFSMRPVARKSDAGTELLWNLGNVKPRDEILINYTIKTAIEGNIKLPKAHARYFDKQGNQAKIFSNPLSIE